MIYGILAISALIILNVIAYRANRRLNEQLDSLLGVKRDKKPIFISQEQLDELYHGD